MNVSIGLFFQLEVLCQLMLGSKAEDECIINYECIREIKHLPRQKMIQIDTIFGNIC